MSMEGDIVRLEYAVREANERGESRHLQIIDGIAKIELALAHIVDQMMELSKPAETVEDIPEVVEEAIADEGEVIPEEEAGEITEVEPEEVSQEVVDMLVEDAEDNLPYSIPFGR